MATLIHKHEGSVLYGRFLFKKGDLIVADWCARADFRGPIHQEGIKASEVQEIGAVGVVHEDDMSVVEQRVSRINARAKKLGVEPVAIHIAEEEIRTREKDGVISKVDRYLTVHLIGRQPVVPGGWKLAALVDFRQSVPLVTTVPGEELTIDPREHGNGCDHCQTTRNRAEVFVLKDEARNVRFIGRKCLGDFLGVASSDPTMALLFYSGMGEKVFSEEGFSGTRSNGFVLREVLALSAAVVNVSGWTSRETSMNTGKSSTSDQVNSYINPPNFCGNAQLQAEYREWRAKVNEELKGEKLESIKLEVEQAIEWTKANRGSEFEKELSDLVQCDFLRNRYFGRAVWVVPGFRLAQDRLKRSEQKKSLWVNSSYVGEVGQRVSLELELISSRNISTDFGVSTLAIFNDGKGNQIKWFASNFPEWKIGEKRQVKATIKKHEEYKGTKQTSVVRVA